MAVYKVPQDVEADDKLIGPFSFKQFIFLMIASLALGAAWGLSQLFVPLAVIPLPIAIFFLAIALPLKKDQPTEVYLAALISFFLKPRKRIWQADGVISTIEITALATSDDNLIKPVNHLEAEKRLSYLADIADTGGWAVRGATDSQASLMQQDFLFEAKEVEASIIENNPIAKTFDEMLGKADEERRQEISRIMSSPASTSDIPPITDPYAILDSKITADNTFPLAPTSVGMPQLTNQPNLTERQTTAKPLSSRIEPSPDIISLATNSKDLTIEAIAKQANIIQNQEVVISLR